MKGKIIKITLVAGLLFFFIAGCIYHQAIRPIGDKTYLVEAELDWSRGITAEKRREILDRLAKSVCSDYRIESESERYNIWSEAFTIQWIISCP